MCFTFRGRIKAGGGIDVFYIYEEGLRLGEG
jgi:hypothetical protein